MTKFFIFAGERSGDLHASRLVSALKKLESRDFYEGVAGPAMRQEGVKTIYPMEDFQVMGFTDVSKALPKLVQRFFSIRNHILKTSPECVILVDYPGFNLRLARHLRTKGFQGRIVQYISPTVWAHGKKRIETLVKNYDLLLTILPFEKKYFEKTDLTVEYVTHPLINVLLAHDYDLDWFKEIGLDSTENLLALFPGSRPGEVHLHLSQQLAAARALQKEDPSLKIAISSATASFNPFISRLAEKEGFTIGKDLFIVPEKFRYELMKACRAAFAKSGTVSLELALHEKPAVIHYIVTPLNYFFAKFFLKLNLPYYCIVNIIDHSLVYPEWIAQKSSAESLAKSMTSLLSEEKTRSAVIEGCLRVKRLCGDGFSYQQAAIAITRLFHVS